MTWINNEKKIYTVPYSADWFKVLFQPWPHTCEYNNETCYFFLFQTPLRTLKLRLKGMKWLYLRVNQYKLNTVQATSVKVNTWCIKKVKHVFVIFSKSPVKNASEHCHNPGMLIHESKDSKVCRNPVSLFIIENLHNIPGFLWGKGRYIWIVYL